MGTAFSCAHNPKDVRVQNLWMLLTWPRASCSEQRAVLSRGRHMKKHMLWIDGSLPVLRRTGVLWTIEVPSSSRRQVLGTLRMVSKSLILQTDLLVSVSVLQR